MSLHDLIRREAAAQVGRAATPRYAIVTAVDPVAHAVKVSVQPEGIESGWITDPGFAAGTLRISAPCEVGTQVMVTPIEGDAEQLSITGRVFDSVVAPAVSPATGKVAQPGEMLIATGQAGPPGNAAQAAQAASWMHLTPGGVFLGIGSTTLTLMQGSIALAVGGVTATLGAAGWVVTGGDVVANGISLREHVHPDVQNGNGVTGLPQG